MPEKLKVFQLSKVYTDGIRIPFSEIFHKDFKEIEDFNLSTKRTYSNNVGFFCEENNKIIDLDKDNEILTNYLMIKFNIDHQRYTNPNIFIISLCTELLKPWFVESTKEYVNTMYDKYCEDIDSNLHNENGKLNSSLVFTNEHSKLLYHIAVLFRLVSPLATHFIYRYSDMISSESPEDLYKDKNGNTFNNLNQAMNAGKIFNKTEFLVEICKSIIRIVTCDNPEMNIYGKLNHYILSLIRSTGFSDKEMWNKLAMRSTSKYSLADAIMDKILIDILPKSSFKKSAIKFIVTTIETHIKWTLTQHFAIHYNMISPISEDSDFSDADRFEINSVKTNEQKKIFNDNFMDDTINIIFTRRGFVMNMDEYNYYYMNNNDIHQVQDNMLRLYFSSPFGGWNNLDGLNKAQYTRLLVYLIHYLNDGGKFKILPKIFTGKVVSVNEKRILPRPVKRKIETSIRYENIMKNYTHTGDTLSKANVIERYIMFILDSKIVYNEYDGKHNGEVIDVNLDEICDEYLKFIELL